MAKKNEPSVPGGLTTRQVADARRAQLKAEWTRRASDLLVGRKIVAVRYTTAKEEADLDLYQGGVVLMLDGGIELYPMADDEGNGPGAVHTNLKALPVIPTI